jgi:hypothetical protein
MSLSRRLWAFRKDNPGFVFLSILTVLVVVIWPVVDAWLQGVEAIHVANYGFNDFGAYTRAVDGWLGEDPIYVENEDGGFHGSYLYPPFVLVVLYPFVWLGFHPGAVLFGALSLFLLWVAVEAVVEQLGGELAVVERIVLLFALFGFHPALWDFKWGQVSTLLAAGLWFAFYTFERGEAGRPRQQYASGVLTTLASSVKIFYATSGAHLLRDRKRFVSALVSAVAVLGFSVLVFGVETHRRYLDVLTWGKGWGTEQMAPFMTQTAYYRPFYLVDQLFERIGLSLPPIWIVIGTVVGVLCVVALALLSRNEPPAARPTFALGVAVVPLLAPRAYTHDLVVLLLPAAILLSLELDRDDGRPWLPVLAVFLLHLHSVGTSVAIHLFDRSVAVLVQPGVYGTFLLVALAAYRIAEHVEARANIATPADG